MIDLGPDVRDDLTIEGKVDLVCRGLQEVLGGHERVQKMFENKPNPTIYWGTATTGEPHIGYLVPLAKISDFLKAGCKVKILLADLHAYLDNLKSPWEVVGEFTLDMYKLATETTIRNASKAGDAVVKQVSSPLLSSTLYPILQCLDEKYLQVDAQFGGVDQRKIFTLAETKHKKSFKHSQPQKFVNYIVFIDIVNKVKCKPIESSYSLMLLFELHIAGKIGHPKCVHLMNPMIPGLKNSKMSSSDSDSKINLLENIDSISKKINMAFLDLEDCENSGIMLFIKHAIYPLAENHCFLIEREEKHGGNLAFNSYQDLIECCKNGSVHPQDIKNSLTKVIKSILGNIQNKLMDEDFKTLKSKAYPSEKIDISSLSISPNSPSRLKIQVGKIVKIDPHPENQNLLVLNIDISGSENLVLVTNNKKLQRYEQIYTTNFCFVTNVSPSKFKGITSFAQMLHCPV
ncbi:MAG: hypothetical protein MHPSP_000607 [Paramarteilia canceri]